MTSELPLGRPALTDAETSVISDSQARFDVAPIRLPPGRGGSTPHRQQVKFKTIVKRGRVFLHRLSIPFRRGSIKLHLILNDDYGDPHIHPWEFWSFLLLGA